jgi:hypothetical protein
MSDEARKFLNSYGDFVTKVTSEPSLDQSSLDARMKEVDSSSPIESARLLTAALGLGSETGEFVEIVKRCSFRGNLHQKIIFFI